MAYQKELVTPVYMTREAFRKQAALVERCNEEVAWFGVCEETEDGFPLVVDILVPRQVVTGGSVDGGTDEGAEYSLAAFLAENAAVVPKLKFTGHSHVHFACVPSTTDLEQIETWAEYNMPYMISHIQNKRGETYTRIDMFEGIHVSAEAEILIWDADEDDPIIRWADDVLDEFVEKKTYTYQHTGYGTGWGGDIMGRPANLRDTYNDDSDAQQEADFKKMYGELSAEDLIGGGL